MISRIYLKLVRYFVILIITTCFTSMVLFFVTVGYPMAKDFHRLLRNHAKYLGQQASEQLKKGVSIEEVSRFLTSASESYEAGIVLFNQDKLIVAGSKGKENFEISITDEMLSVIYEKGLYVQSSHMGKPLVYVLPVSSVNNGMYYLCIYKTFSRLKRLFVFTLGLVILCFFLILAIYPLSKGFTKPLSQLSDALKEIAAGNFDFAIDTGNRKDELGDLLRVFHDMSKSVDIMIESRKVLLADISHELRSPLGRLSITAELIKQEEQPDNVVGYIDNIEYEIHFMDNLLKQLSVYSILNLPETQLHMEEFCASTIVCDIVNRYMPIMEKNKISFVQESFEKSIFIVADRAKIVQVLNNLLDNAINACESHGEIKIWLTETVEEVIFHIANTGREIPENKRGKIFEPLFRTDPSRSRKTGGFGLGLAISKKIIEHHDGTIFCDCDDGITEFLFGLKKSVVS